MGVFLFLGLFLSSCTSSADSMIGKWVSDEWTNTLATISKQDDGYVLKITNDDLTEITYKGKYSKGSLVFSYPSPAFPDRTLVVDFN